MWPYNVVNMPWRAVAGPAGRAEPAVHAVRPQVYDMLGDTPALKDNVFSYESETQGGK